MILRQRYRKNLLPIGFLHLRYRNDPRVFLYFLNLQPLRRVFQQHPANQVPGLRREAQGELRLAHGDINKHIFLGLRLKRGVPHQHLVKQHPQTPHISRGVVRSLLHHFGRQVLRSPADGGAGLYLIAVVVGPAEVRQLHAVVGVQQDVLRLYVAVDYRRDVRVQVVYCQKHLAEVLGRLTLHELLLTVQAVEQVAVLREFHYQVETFVVLEVVKELRDVRVVQVVHDVHLAAELALHFDHFVLADLFEGVDLFGDLVTHLPDVAEGAVAEFFLEVEVAFVDLGLLTADD